MEVCIAVVTFVGVGNVDGNGHVVRLGHEWQMVDVIQIVGLSVVDEVWRVAVENSLNDCGVTWLTGIVGELLLVGAVFVA